MIMAIDFLPNVDYKYNVDKLIMQGTMDSNSIKVHTSSKAIHSLRGMKILQSEVLFTGILGGFVGKYTKHHMDIRKIKSDIIWSDVETPHNIIIEDEETGSKTTIRKTKQIIDQKTSKKLIQKTKTNIERVDTVVLECRKLEDIEEDTYSSLVLYGKKYSTKTIITTGNKEVLESVLKASPYGLVFNVNQLNAIGFETSNIEELVKGLIPYLRQGVHYIGVDLKERGALLLSPNKLCYIEPMIDVKKQWNTNVTGAFLGGIAIGIDRKYEQEKIAKIAGATALAAWQQENYNKSSIDKLTNKVKIREMSKELYN